MNVAIVGAGSAIGQALAERLTPEHSLITLAPADPGVPQAHWRPVETWAEETLAPLLEGVEVLVHAGLYEPEAVSPLTGDQAWLDVGGRVTWHLHQAAVKAGVGRLIYLSSLELLAGYPPGLRVASNFEPRPAANARSLGFHLLEAQARVARPEHPVPIRIARLGELVRAAEVDPADYQPLWVDLDDAATVVAALLQAEDPRRWWSPGIVHVCADRPDALSRPGGVRRWLGVELKETFGYVAGTEAAE